MADDRTRRALLAGIVALAVLTAAFIVIGVARSSSPEPRTQAKGPWRTDAVLQKARDDFGTAVVDGRIWAVGGMSGARGNLLDSIEVYRPERDSWVSGPSLPLPRSNTGTVAVGNVVYVVGGLTSGMNLSDTAAALDTGSGQWRELPDLPTPRYELGAVAVGARIYAIGGEGRNGPTATVEIFDTRSGTWSSGPPLPEPKGSLRAVALAGKIYAIGGITAGEPTRDVQVFDLDTHRWSTGPPLPAPLANFGLGAYSGRVHALHHEDHFTYRPGADSWERAPAMPTSRHGQGVASVGGRMYVMGGCTEQPLRDVTTVESFAPA